MIARGSSLAFDIAVALQAPKLLISTVSKLLIAPLDAVVIAAAMAPIFYVLSTFVFIYSLLIGTLIADIYRNILGYLESHWLCPGVGLQELSFPPTAAAEAGGGTSYPIPFHDGLVGTAIANGHSAVTSAAFEV